MQPIQGTISIVSHGHGALIRNLLDDLKQQVEIENWFILITLNIPEPFERIAGLNMEIIANDIPKGFGGNHNAAAEKAQGALFLIVNPDIRLTKPDTLQRIGSLDWSGRPKLRAPAVVAPDGSREDSVRANLSLPNLVSRVKDKRAGWEADPEKHRFFWLAGMFLIVPLKRFRALGGFDERFRLYCEDYDLCARWRIAGGDIELVLDMSVIHDARRDSHRSFRHLRWHLSSLLKVWMSGAFWRIARGRYE